MGMPNDGPTATVERPAQPESPYAIPTDSTNYTAKPNLHQRWRHDLLTVRRWVAVAPRTWGQRITSPFGAIAIVVLLVVGLTGYGIGAALGGSPAAPQPGDASMSSGSTTASTSTGVPNASQQQGNQLAKFTRDSDGAKHFTLTAQQVMWEPVKGQRILAWTLDGTVPGPMIRVRAGDHVRITIVNHLPAATAIHWHGLQVPTDSDGVPPVGMKPIQPGQRYTYDFTIRDDDVGTHWYHSHYDDLRQVGGGLYGAFIVDPRPDSPQARQAIVADVETTMFVGMLGSYFVINGKSFPDTQPLVVKHSQTVHIRLIGADVSMIHPMHLHGHYFRIVAEDGRLLPQPIQKDTISLAPGETYDLTFYAWSAPGSIYPLHCHILSHLMNPGQSGDEMGGLIVLVTYAS